MKSFRPFDRKLRSALKFFSCAIAFTSVSLSSALAAGTVRGRVLNETTGEYLEGAFVQVIGTEINASTDLQGNYRFSNVPEGAQSIRVSYLGLGNQSKTVEVSSEVTQTIDFTLAEDIVELEGVRVQASLTGRSAAINQQRVATGIKNIVNQDDFGQMNDGNLGMALRRMPGLSVDTDGGTEVPRYVNIRGFDASLNSVTLDGNRLASSESGSPSQRGGGTAYGGAARAFALDDLPADAITNVEIVKSPTPDMDGAALGGSVNLVTKTAFERSGRNIDYRVSGSYSELRDDYGYNFGLTYSDLVNAFGGDRNLGISVTLSRYDQSEGFNNRDYDWLPISPSNDGINIGDVRPTDGLVNDYLAPQILDDLERTGQIVINFNEDTEFNNYNIDRARTGLSASFDLKLNDKTTLYFKPTYGKEKRSEEDFRHHLVMDSSDVTGLHHGDKINNKDFFPLDRYVSLWGSHETEFDNGNYEAFRAAVEGTNLETGVYNPGDSITVDGETIVFDPGALVRLGDHPTRISTFRPGSSDRGARTTYNPDGSGRGKLRYESDFEEIDIELLNLNFGGETLMDWGKVKYGLYLSENTKSSEEFEHEFERRGVQLGYTRPDEDIYSFDWTIENGIDRFGIPSQSAVDRFRDNDLEHKQYEVNEEYLGANFDVEYDLAGGDNFSGSIKAGVKLSKMDRSYDYDEREWDLASSFPFADYLLVNPYEPIYGKQSHHIPYVPDAPRIRAAVDTNPDWFSEQFGANINDSVVNDYNASEDTNAIYAMGDLNFGKLDIVFGARWEETKFSTDSFQLDETWANFINDEDPEEDPNSNLAQLMTLNAFTFNERSVVPGVESQSRTYDEFLPSAHFKYSFTDNLIGRFSVGRTYAKPAIKDMVGSISVTDEGGGDISVDIPNFDLPTQVSDNVDVSIEYYTQGGRYGVGYFRKDMTNYAWNETFETTSYPGYEGLNAKVSRPVANTDAVNSGFEFFLDQSLSIFGDSFRDFSFSGNYTYTDSEALYYTGRIGPTIGHSKNMYNLAITYDNRTFSTTLRWQYRDPFFENISISDFEDSETLPPELQFIFDDTFMNPGTLDAEFGYRINERFNLFANVTNITEGINASRQGYYAYPEDSYPHQRRWTFGVKGSF